MIQRTLEKKYVTVSASNKGLALVLGLSLLAACSSDVVVADEPGSDGDGGDCHCSVAPDPYIGSGECASEDEAARSAYDAWLAQVNRVSPLAPGVWTGTIDDRAVTLTIDPDYAMRLTVGDALAIDAEVGPFCEPAFGFGDCGGPFPEGAVYPIHGASTQGDKLTLPIRSRSAYTEWCALQEPTNEGWERCEFGGLPNLGFSMPTTDECEIGGAPIECGRLALLSYILPSVCGCTSDGCFVGFSGTEQEDVDLPMTLEIVDGGDLLEGEGPSGEPVKLERVD